MKPYASRLLELVHDDPFNINIVLNNFTFGGLVEEAVSLARDAVARYPQHAFVLYQGHRALLWGGHTEEAAALVGPIRRSEFPEETVELTMLRQACAEGDPAAAEQHYQAAIAAYNQDSSIKFIGLQILGRPDEAHQALIDSKLDKWAAAGFLNYPYFNHTLFPELAAALEQQGIDRKFVEGPPYACKPGQS
jgi:predicted Zn-dependent protease